MTRGEKIDALMSDSGFLTAYGDVLAVGKRPAKREFGLWINGHLAILTPEEVDILRAALRTVIEP